MNKKGQNKGDECWAKAAQAWNDCRHVTKGMFVGDNLFYKKIKWRGWNNIKGCIQYINMGGWGEKNELDLRAMFNQMAWTKTLIIVLIDHRREAHNTSQIEFLAQQAWTGGGKGENEKAMWTHSPARNRHIGGISIGIHPIMARYA